MMVKAVLRGIMLERDLLSVAAEPSKARSAAADAPGVGSVGNLTSTGVVLGYAIADW